MVHKHQPITINLLDDIFQNDKLERKNAIEDLSFLLESTTQSFVLGLNADWGAGKTTFVKLWQAYLQKEKGMQSIYFSAWEDDFSKEPLISILGEIKNYIIENCSDEPEIARSFEKAKSIGAKVFKRVAPALVKNMTGGLVDCKVIGDAIDDIAESTAKELIDNYSKDKKITEEFKNAIQELLSKIDAKKPFVIFIDELDRCRPLYAIELLERIKHMFGIDGLIFVLSIDKKQLAESIKSQYGNIDAQTYLRRFIDIEYTLQNPSLDKFCTYLYYDVYKLDNAIKEKNIAYYCDDLEMLQYCTKVFNLSLRDVEQVFIRLKIIFKTIVPRFLEIHFEIIFFFLSFKMKYPDKYELLITRKISEKELRDIFDTKKIIDSIQTMIKAIFLATSKSEQEMIDIIKYQKEVVLLAIEENQFSTVSPERDEQKRLIELLEYPYGYRHNYKLNNVIETVIHKVEFADKFNFEIAK